MEDYKSSKEIRINAPEMHQKKSLPKTHLDYWKNRLVKRDYSHNGETKDVSGYQIQISFKGDRRWFNTREDNKDKAAKKVRDFHKVLLVKGWEETLKELNYRGGSRSKSPTVGDYIREAMKCPDIDEGTLNGYCAKFRTLVSEIMKIPSDKSKHDHMNGGYEKWKQKVEAVRLGQLSPKKVQDWKKKRLEIAGGSNPVKQASVRTSANSIIRCVKSLFGKKVSNFIELDLPEPFFLEGVEFFKESKKRYKSKIDDLDSFLLTARKELVVDIPPLNTQKGKIRESKEVIQEAKHKRESYKILLLALGSGLRREEIDILRWEQVNFTKNVISVESNEYGTTKTDYSDAEVDVSPALLTQLKKMKGNSSSEFVIESQNMPNPKAKTYQHYRCYKSFRYLTKWLRSKGINSQKPLHELRKEFGSIIADKAGIFQASIQLRHSNIQTTRNHYIDKKNQVVVPLDILLDDDLENEEVA